MAFKVITPPTSEPVTDEQAKLWLRLDSDAEIDTVAMLIAAARETLDGYDGYLGRCLVTQTLAMTLDRFPCEHHIVVPLPPLQEVISVKYLDTSGAEQTLSSANYRLAYDDQAGRILLNAGAAWPSAIADPSAITVTFTAGYANGIPQGLRAEILRLIGIWFDDRSMLGQLPDGWSSRYRVMSV